MSLCPHIFYSPWAGLVNPISQASKQTRMSFQIQKPMHTLLKQVPQLQ